MEQSDVPKALFKGLPLPAYAWQRRQEDFFLIDYNDAAVKITNGRIQGLLGQTANQVYGSDNAITADIERCYHDKETFSKEMEYEFRSVKQTRFLKTTYAYIHPDIVMVFTEDITALRETTDQLRRQESLLSAIVDGISEAVVAVDGNGTITFVNRAALELFEYTEPELIGSSIEMLVPIPSRSRHVDLRRDYMNQPRTRRMGKGMNLTARKKDGREFPVEIGLDYINIDDTATVVALISDITERRKVELEVERAATLDPLTNLLNRRAFLGVLGSEHSRARRYDLSYSIILTDIDHFKRLNDTYGHDFGDAVLVSVAETLQQGLRDVDRVCRWGGEEFIILLPETAIMDAATVAEKIRLAVEQLKLKPDELTQPVEQPETPEGSLGTVTVTMSFGVIDNAKSDKTETLINLADQNLYRAKSSGRNRVVSG